MSPTSIFFLLAGLVVLSVGAEFLVRGASRLASSLGVPALLVGLTVVSVGTSAPELVVTIRSALTGRPELALGNVMGSNIFNVLFILGISALITPLVVSRPLIRRDVPLMIAVSLGVWIMSADGIITRAQGVVLLLCAVAYTALLGVAALRHEEAGGSGIPLPISGDASPAERSAKRMATDLALVVFGCAGLILGASWLIEGAVEVARLLGVSELVIGLTLIAGGTSLPEVAASIVAAVRGERDLAVGNIVGSNLFNLLVVLGAGAAIAPGGIPVAAHIVAFDLPIMTAVAVACFPIFLTGASIERWEGGVFLAYYLVYVLFLVLDAINHPGLATLSAAMLFFLLPLTVLTFGVVAAREFYRKR